MNSFHHTQPWRQHLENNNSIDPINPLAEQADEEEAACYAVGKFIKAWFTANPDQQTLLLQRDQCGMPMVKTGTNRAMAKTFKQFNLKETFSNRWTR